MTKSRFWTADEDDQLRLLIDRGLTAREIGMELKRSRNSVISRTHRLHVSFSHGLMRGRPGEPRQFIWCFKPVPCPPWPGLFTDEAKMKSGLCLKPGCRNTRQPYKPFCASHIRIPERKRDRIAAEIAL